MSKNDGGPAFPCVVELLQSGDFAGTIDTGMSLRDYFAGEALPGIFSYASSANEIISDGKAASWAYSIADAMLAERDK